MWLGFGREVLVGKNGLLKMLSVRAATVMAESGHHYSIQKVKQTCSLDHFIKSILPIKYYNVLIVRFEFFELNVLKCSF